MMTSASSSQDLLQIRKSFNTENMSWLDFPNEKIDHHDIIFVISVSYIMAGIIYVTDQKTLGHIENTFQQYGRFFHRVQRYRGQNP